MEFRNLSEAEITALEKQGCFCSNWNDLNVKKDFSPGNIKNTVFKGKNFLGMLNEGDSGIFNSEITDCTIEDGSFISNVNQLVNYKIEANTVIENVNKISADENSSFGIGVKISVLNEAGGRELPLIPNLSSQIAYLIANYRHDAEMQDKLAQLCLNEIKKHKFSKGTIGSRSRISNVKEIKNVNIGECTVIENSALLKNGTIISNIDDPVFLGSNVNCENFVVLPGASITNNAVLENCFIGQAVKIGKQYSAENSAFFANCELFHGEACSIFAGPYTVSHHKSSLLIAGYFSFYNAGSGTNQSNHM
jgi:carbonic anhydrase/acetyltransferase-like protein (isoleucine patch superfamily)